MQFRTASAGLQCNDARARLGTSKRCASESYHLSPLLKHVQTEDLIVVTGLPVRFLVMATRTTPKPKKRRKRFGAHKKSEKKFLLCGAAAGLLLVVDAGKQTVPFSMRGFPRRRDPIRCSHSTSTSHMGRRFLWVQIARGKAEERAQRRDELEETVPHAV